MRTRNPLCDAKIFLFKLTFFLMYVIKASGEKQEFDREKIKSTCRRAGAPEWLAEKVAKQVEKRVRNGVHTKEILKITLSLLDKEFPHVAAKYDLKRAIMRLGPAGYEFEKFVAELLSRYGYETSVHNILKGKCVSHEVDIIAKNNSDTVMIECKYHNNSGIYTGVRDVLYTKARFDDIREAYGNSVKNSVRLTKCWVVSNTRFSSEAIKYAKCRKITVLGWDYPRQGIKAMLERKKLYPITIIRSLSRYMQNKLFDAGVVFCIDLLNTDVSRLSLLTGINKRQLNALRAEVERLIGNDSRR